MPVHVEKRGAWWVTVDGAGKVHGRSKTKAKAEASAHAINQRPHALWLRALLSKHPSKQTGRRRRPGKP